MKRLALLLVLLLSAGCPKQTPATDDDAVVIFKSDVPDAALWVDGRYVGPVSSLKGGVAVSPGVHRFELRDDGHFSHYVELTLAPDDRQVLEVHLAPILP
jgi:hypothetical protein